MSQIIPGGRARSSSDGDILSDVLCGTFFGTSNDHSSTDGSRRNLGKGENGFVNISNNNSSVNNLNSSDETLDSESKLSSQSRNSARSGRKGLLFKSMKKAVSRVFVKDPKHTDPTVKSYEKSSQVWTPNLRHLKADNTFSENGNVPTGTSSTARPLITRQSISPTWKTTPGAVGICNVGNNCFMNAVLQCLSNTDSFTEYFIRDFFKIDLKNNTNSKKRVFRSSHGEVTEQLGNFLKCLWSNRYSLEVSQNFKRVVGKFNNQYKGDDQHDAQEFLLWLLDCIHEDVSTLTRKKVKIPKASIVKTDKELALEAQSANGESFILKLFQALHSSTLTCPTCGEQSSTFDPYLCVSLPLPQGNLRIIYVVVVYVDFHDYQEVKMAFTLNQHDDVRELRELVAAEARIPLKQLLLVQLKNDCFGATYSDEQLLSEILDDELVYAIESHSDSSAATSSTQQFDSPTFQVLVIHVEVMDKSAHRFGSPAMVKVRRDISYENLQMEILKKMENSLCEEIFSEPDIKKKLGTSFSLRVYDGRARKLYLPYNVDMPLYSQCADRAYSLSTQDFGPCHLKVIAEWEPETKFRVVLDDKEHIENYPSIARAKKSKLGQGSIDLDDCFRLYTQEEKLGGEVAWQCSHCKRQQHGTIKTLRLWSLPEILVLHLKRFKQTGRRRSKLNTLIHFPIDGLDMTDHLSYQSQRQSFKDDYIYDLVGVSNHYGNMMGGHYTAYCRSPIDMKWREYDDVNVRILEGPVVTREAYILFYERRSLRKTVSWRLRNGDHWIYSLPLAPSERTEHNSKHTRSRSASPSTHRPGVSKAQTNPIHSFTPQPVRWSMISINHKKDQDLSDDSTRSPSPPSSKFSSRSLQRDSSDLNSPFTNEKTGGYSSFLGLKDTPRTPLQSGSDFSENKFSHEKLELNSHLVRNHQDAGSSRYNSDSNSRTTGTHNSPPLNVSKHDPLTHNTLVASTTWTAKNRTSLNSKFKEPHASSYVPIVIPKKKDDKIVDHFSNINHDSSTLTVAENDGKKLASITKHNIINKSYVDHDTTKNQSNEIRTLDRQSNLGLATQKTTSAHSQVNMPASHASSSDKSHSVENVANTTKYVDQGPHDGDQTTHSVNFGIKDRSQITVKDIKDSNLTQDLNDSDFDNKTQGEKLSHRIYNPSEAKSGRTNGLISSNNRTISTFVDDTVIGQGSLCLKGDVSYTDKSATIARTYNIHNTGKFEQGKISDSKTDHNIHHNISSFVSHPSPSPSNGYPEGQRSNHKVFASKHRLTGGVISSSFKSAGQHSRSQNSLSYETRILPRQMAGSQARKYNFHCPRDALLKSEPAAKSLASISNPCLRESSV